MSVRKERLAAIGPVVAYMALIFGLSSLPSPPHFVDALPFQDRGAHFLEYGVLGLLTARAAFRLLPDRPAIRLVLFALIVSVGFAITDELHQTLVPGRTGDVIDLLADALGATAGAVAFAVLRRR
ncbi:MAG: VanZ family protein [Polyangiales bacterium]